MLVITRKPGDKIQLSNGIEISIEGIAINKVRIGIEAPKAIHIRRSNKCVCCRKPCYDYYLGYHDIPWCGSNECANVIKRDNKSLFD